jgi:hypothetical protein
MLDGAGSEHKMSIMSGVQFLDTFVGPCQHLGLHILRLPGMQPRLQCTMQVSTRLGVTCRCTANWPLTEIRARPK